MSTSASIWRPPSGVDQVVSRMVIRFDHAAFATATADTILDGEDKVVPLRAETRAGLELASRAYGCSREVRAEDTNR